MLDFFERIESLLKTKKTSQKELADYLGLSSAQVFTNWKLRNSMPTADVACKIARYLNTSVEYLVNGKETDENKIRLDSLLSELSATVDKYKHPTTCIQTVTDTKETSDSAE